MIGQILWHHDNGKWVSHIVTGETKLSWIIKGDWFEIKILKKDLTENLKKYGRRQWYSTQDKEDRSWLSDNRYKLAYKIERLNDISKLKEIAKILEHTDGSRL